MDKYLAMANKMMQPNAHAQGVMKLLEKYYPSFATKVLDRNPLMRGLAMYGMCNMDILLYPICGHCETLAAWSSYAFNKDGTPMFKPDGSRAAVCTCRKCGYETVNPITFKEWCAIELKKKAPEDIGDELELAVDAVAARCVADAERLYNRIAKKERYNVQSE